MRGGNEREKKREKERKREKELPKALHSKRDYLELSKKYFLHARKPHFYIFRAFSLARAGPTF